MSCFAQVMDCTFHSSLVKNMILYSKTKIGYIKSEILEI